LSAAPSSLPAETLQSLRRKMQQDRERIVSPRFYQVGAVATLPAIAPPAPEPAAPAPAPAPQPQLVRKREPAIQWADYPRIEPGEYDATSGSARVYFDKAFRRHICMVRFVIVGDTTVKIPWFLNLGDKEAPSARRRSKYWAAWMQANGGPPKRGDRLSPRIFEHRAARILVADTTQNYCGEPNFLTYSTVRNVLTWNTR
jgi:hypothetical protein